MLKCIKWQDLLEEEKMDAMRFERVHRLILEKYNYFGVRGHFRLHKCQKPHLQFWIILVQPKDITTAIIFGPLSSFL